MTFNPGEPVLGTTAPGWAALLGTLSRAAGERLRSPEIATALGLASILLGPFWVWRAADRSTPEPAARRRWVAWWIGTTASLLLLRWNLELLGGEQFAILALLAGGTTLTLVQDRPALGGGLIALAGLLRLDAMPALALVGLVSALARRRIPWAFLAGGLLVAGPGLAALSLEFGSPIPLTLAGKRGEMAAATESYAAAEWRHLGRVMPGATGPYFLALAAAGLGLALRGRRHPSLLAALAWLVWREAFYHLVGVPFAAWYHIESLAILVGLATWAVTAPISVHPRLRFAAPVGLVLLVPFLLPSIRWLGTSWGAPPDSRYPLYREIGEALDRDTEPGLVATVEIGILGYFAPDHPILDLVGLVSPEAQQARDPAARAELLRRLEPHFVVDVPLFHRRYPELARIARDPTYRDIGRFAGGPSGRGRVRLLERTRGAGP